MTAHDWFIEHRIEFAAGTLGAGEMETFREHIARCDSCPDAVRRIEDELRWLPMGVSPVTPRPGLERRILEHAVGRSPGRLRRYAVPFGIAASLVSGLAGWQLGQYTARASTASAVAVAPPAPSPAPDTLSVQLAALADTLSIMRQAARVMQARIMMHGKEGGMVIFADPRTHRWNVVVHGLPKAPANERYQFWFITADGMVRGAEVRMDAASPMLFTTGMPAPDHGAVLGAALTMEPLSASDGPPKGKELAHVML